MPSETNMRSNQSHLPWQPVCHHLNESLYYDVRFITWKGAKTVQGQIHTLGRAFHVSSIKKGQMSQTRHWCHKLHNHDTSWCLNGTRKSHVMNQFYLFVKCNSKLNSMQLRPFTLSSRRWAWTKWWWEIESSKTRSHNEAFSNCKI